MLLSRALASADSFRCTSFAMPSRGEATAICTAAMPTPRAFLGLEEPLPDHDPTSDAPSRPSRHPRIGSMHRPAAVSARLSLKRPLGGALLANFSFGKDAGVSTFRIDREDQDASATADKGDHSASGAPTVVSRRHRRAFCRSMMRAGGWMLDADSTPQPSIAHPFASIPPERPRQRRDSGSFVARRLVVTVFRQGPRSFPKMRATDRCQTYDFTEHPRFVRRPRPSSFRPWPRCGARFTALLTLRRPARAPCRGFSPPRW